MHKSGLLFSFAPDLDLYIMEFPTRESSGGTWTIGLEHVCNSPMDLSNVRVECMIV